MSKSSLELILEELNRSDKKKRLSGSDTSVKTMLSDIRNTVDLSHKLMSLTDLYNEFQFDKLSDTSRNTRSAILPEDFIELNISEQYKCITEKYSKAIDLMRDYLSFVTPNTFVNGYEFRIFSETSDLFDHTAFLYETAHKQTAGNDDRRLIVSFDTTISYEKEYAYEKAKELLVTLKSLVWFADSLSGEVTDINTFSFTLLQIHTISNDIICFLHVVSGIL